MFLLVIINRGQLINFNIRINMQDRSLKTAPLEVAEFDNELLKKLNQQQQTDQKI
jgi:hypothetical protein